MSKYVITYDVGTTGVKTCLIEIGDTMRILASDTAGYGLYVDDETGVKGGAEQDAEEWWDAMCTTTKEIFTKTDIKPEQIVRRRDQRPGRGHQLLLCHAGFGPGRQSGQLHSPPHDLYGPASRR